MATQPTAKTKKRLSRRDMKEDKLIAWAQKVELFYIENRKIFWGIGLGAIIVLAAIFLIRANRQKGFEEASLSLTIAKLKFVTGLVEESEPEFRTLKASYGGRIAGEAQYYLARTAFLRGNVGEAEVAFREYLDNYSVDKYLDVAALAGLAASIEAQKRFAEAAEIYISIPRKYPKHHYSPEAMYQAARCYLWAGQKDKAIETCQVLQRQYPTSSLRNRASKLVALFP